MQTAGTTLPEFEPVRHNPKSAPKRRQRGIISILRPQISKFVLEYRPRLDHRALPRGPRAYLTVERARFEIVFRFFARCLFRDAVYHNLTVYLRPEKAKCCVGIRRQVVCLPAFVVGKKNKSLLIKPF